MFEDSSSNEWRKRTRLASPTERLDMKIIVGVCREDDPQDVDEAYGPGTYARLFPESEDEDENEGGEETGEGSGQEV